MAVSVGRFECTFEGHQLQLVSNDETLTMSISQQNKLYYWKGDLSDETLKATQNTFSSTRELFEALQEVLSGKSVMPSKPQLVLGDQDSFFSCSFTFYKKSVEIVIPLSRTQQNMERVQEHLWNRMSSTVLEVHSLERKTVEHIRMQSEALEGLREEEFKKIEKTKEDLQEQFKSHLEQMKQEAKSGDMMTRLETGVELLNKQMMVNQKEIDKKLNDLSDRLISLEKQKPSLAAARSEQWIPRFVGSRNGIRVSNDNKTATKIENDCKLEGIFGTPSIPSKGEHKFSFKIIQTNGRFIYMGVALYTMDLNSYSNIASSAKTWMLYLYDGQMYNERRLQEHAKKDIQKAGGVKAGDVIGVQVNSNERTLQFYLNEKPLGATVILTLQENELQHLVPALDLCNLNDAVEFI